MTACFQAICEQQSLLNKSAVTNYCPDLVHERNRRKDADYLFTFVFYFYVLPGNYYVGVKCVKIILPVAVVCLVPIYPAKPVFSTLSCMCLTMLTACQSICWIGALDDTILMARNVSVSDTDWSRDPDVHLQNTNNYLWTKNKCIVEAWC